MKRIILSADDFARSHERNLAIDHAFKNGLICSAAVIMGSEFTNEAIDFAMRGGYLRDIHCHLNLISGIADGNRFLPLSDEYKNSKFCYQGDFTTNKCVYFSRIYSEIVYKELEKQYSEFIKATGEKANYDHVDFHVYRNLIPSVAVAYQKLISNYHIKTARYYGMHHKYSKALRQKIKLLTVNFLSGDKPRVIKSCNIDFYLTKPGMFSSDETVELYVHPDYVGGILLDNTVSIFGHEKVPLAEHIKQLYSTGELELISWTDL